MIYGINPCVLQKIMIQLPIFLPRRCMLQLRRNIKKNWADKINSKSVDAYIMAVAGHSNDGKKWRDDQGMFITPKYNHLIFVAKISEILTMKEYLLNVPVPRSFSYVKRNIPEVTVEQRERALKATHYNEFAFPAGMLTVDMLVRLRNYCYDRSTMGSYVLR